MTRRLIAVFGSSTTEPGSADWEVAHGVGRQIGEAGFGVVTGGYGGTMESTSAGAASTGAPVVGVIAPALFPGRPGANPHVGEVVVASSLSERIGMMFELASAAIALPGSIGTATELMIGWNLNYIGRHNDGSSFPIAAVGESWRRVGESLHRWLKAQTVDVHWASDGATAVDWVLREIAKTKPD